MRPQPLHLPEPELRLERAGAMAGEGTVPAAGRHAQQMQPSLDGGGQGACRGKPEEANSGGQRQRPCPPQAAVARKQRRARLQGDHEREDARAGGQDRQKLQRGRRPAQRSRPPRSGDGDFAPAERQRGTAPRGHEVGIAQGPVHAHSWIGENFRPPAEKRQRIQPAELQHDDRGLAQRPQPDGARHRFRRNHGPARGPEQRQRQERQGERFEAHEFARESGDGNGGNPAERQPLPGRRGGGAGTPEEQDGQQRGIQTGHQEKLGGRESAVARPAG
jgi:hypothetical protein